MVTGRRNEPGIRECVGKAMSGASGFLGNRIGCQFGCDRDGVCGVLSTNGHNSGARLWTMAYLPGSV